MSILKDFITLVEGEGDSVVPRAHGYEDGHD